MDEDRQRKLQRNAKLARSWVRRTLSNALVVRVLAGIGIMAILVLGYVNIIHSEVLFVKGEPAKAFDHAEVHIEQEVDVEGLRGRNLMVNYLPPLDMDEPIEVLGDWEIPKVTRPLLDKYPRLRRFRDSPENYDGTDAKHLHGDLGRNPDGEYPNWWERLVVDLNRTMPDYRDDYCKDDDVPFYNEDVVNELGAASVVIIFSNEPWETLMRTVHSVFNRTPPHLLYEIVLVDDGSTRAEYTVDGNNKLLAYLECCLPRKVRLTRTNTRAGITRARLQGIKVSRSDFFIVLDSHCEVEEGWIQPLLYRTSKDPKVFVMPRIDSIKKEGYVPIGSGVGCNLGVIWKIMEHALTPNPNLSPADRIVPNDKKWGFTTSPSMSGGLFGGSREVFLDLGGYDLGMSGWGAENVEFGFRLWQCGARLECSECSRVGHIFGRGQFYKQKGGEAVVNRLRTASVWMDNYAYLAWVFNGMPDWKKQGDVSQQIEARENMQCNNFQWFLDNVFPETMIGQEAELVYGGWLRPKLHPSSCLQARLPGDANKATMEACGQNKKSLSKFWMYFSRYGSLVASSHDEGFLRSDLVMGWSNPEAFNQRWDLIIDGDALRLVSKDSGKCLIGLPDLLETKICSNSDEELWLWEKINMEELLKKTF